MANELAAVALLAVYIFGNRMLFRWTVGYAARVRSWHDAWEVSDKTGLSMNLRVLGELKAAGQYIFSEIGAAYYASLLWFVYLGAARNVFIVYPTSAYSLKRILFASSMVWLVSVLAGYFPFVRQRMRFIF